VTVAELRTHVVAAPLHTPFVTAVRSTEVVESVLVQAVDGDGRSGWGEGVSTWRITGDSIAGIEAAVSGPLRDVVVGRDVDDLDALLRDVGSAIVGNTAAKAAVDGALHDLAAVRLGIPLPRLLGSAALDLPTDITLAADSPTAMATAAKARRGDGFDVLKIKVGDGGADDVTRVHAIRESAGKQAILRLDANQGWSPREAVRIIGTLEDAGLDIELVEQPVRAGDLDGLAFVTAHVQTPILADEAVSSARDLLEITRRRAADMVNIKLAKCGGLRAGRALLAVAEAAGVDVLIGSMMETHVGVGAAASLAAISGSPLVHDLDAAWWLRRSPVEGGPRYEQARLRFAAAPGLGISGLAP